MKGGAFVCKSTLRGHLQMTQQLLTLMLCELNQQAKLHSKPTTKGRLNSS